jgi:penicillin-binding protein 1A
MADGKRASRGPAWHRFRQGARIGALVLAVLMVAAIAWAAWLASTAPTVTHLRQAESARPSVVLSADGQLLARFSQAQREWITLDQVAKPVLEALIATEDHRFYEHAGIDVKRTLAAIWHTTTGSTQGGSTITQQLARNLFPQAIGRERTLSRKVREMATALRIERAFDKRQILEAYLNSAPFLYNVVGIEMAARTYFDKPAAELGTLEAATLVGMLKGTAYYNPVRYPERAQKRRNVVLGQMARHGVLPADELQRLSAAPLAVRFTRQSDPAEAAPHFVAQVRKDVLEWADRHGRDLDTEGLVIHTTLDSRLQAAATRAVEVQGQLLQAVADVEWSSASLRGAGALESYPKLAKKVEPFGHFWQRHAGLLSEFASTTPEYREAVAAGQPRAAALKTLLADKAFVTRLKRERTRLEAGLVAIDPGNGAVRAWVGSRDFDLDQFDHVVQAARQPGSTFKPFVYAAALESGIPSWQSYLDAPVAYDLGQGKTWRPTDMKGSSGMPMSLRSALVYSKNTITVQVAQQLGAQRVADTARALGVESRLDVVPSLALGTSPVTLLEMVGAYTTLARQGDRVKPLLVQRIEDRHGMVLADFAAERPAPQRVLSADTAIELTDILRDAVNRGTGTGIRNRFGITADVAGKTGTTQDNTDGWFILMHPQLVTGAWVGFNDQRVSMRSNHWGQGANTALLMVGDFVRSALREKWLDAKASFPPGRRPVMPVEEPPLPPEAELPGDAGWSWTDAQAPAAPTQAALAAAQAVSHVASAPAGGSIAFGDRAGVAALQRDAAGSATAPPKTALELERALANMAAARDAMGTPRPVRSARDDAGAPPVASVQIVLPAPIPVAAPAVTPAVAVTEPVSRSATPSSGEPSAGGTEARAGD